MRGITKQFPGVLANDHIDFSLRQGEIHALLGENGAGKTTLMKILYGLYLADSGEIYVKGVKQEINDPACAIRLGIGMVHQHFMLIPPFTVAENIILGMEPSKARIHLDIREAARQVTELSAKYGLKVDPFARVEDISVGMQQRTEILKALYRGAEVLILDEPTAVLTPQEVDELMETMRSLARQGKSIIFITHKLTEVMAIADRVTIVRRGKVVGTLEKHKTNVNELATLMVGRDVSLGVQKKEQEPGRVLLDVHNLTALNNRRLPALKRVSFSLRAGEILGIAGVEGNGQTELVEVITGLRQATSGHIFLDGKEVTNLPPSKIIASGMAHIPEDRVRRGLIADFTVAENMILESHNKSPFARGLRILWENVRSATLERIREFDIRTPSEDVPVRSLSGGNLQKVILARELSRDPLVIIAVQPTRGLDVGAIEFVHSRLLAAREAGKAVLLVSLELEEILALSDRIAVMYEGEIVGEMPAKQATEQTLGLLMAGAMRLQDAS
ncbi:MAG: ABC transporter ATP-binding protein [Firmicutes bacterium]|nr:ABC transporter ATP-binding protein [Bacillota bacterium]